MKKEMTHKNKCTSEKYTTMSPPSVRNEHLLILKIQNAFIFVIYTDKLQLWNTECVNAKIQKSFEKIFRFLLPLPSFGISVFLTILLLKKKKLGCNCAYL